MTFYFAFWKTFRSRPMAALAALFWHVTGRKVRARNRLRISLAQSPKAYPIWINTIERQADIVAQAQGVMASWRYRPLFTVLTHQTCDWNQATVDALRDMMRSQAYPAWEVVIVRASQTAILDVGDAAGCRFADKRADSAADALRIGIAESQGDYLLPLPSSAVLPATSLFRYAEALQAQPDARLLFGDNDWIDRQGARRSPWFKPEWNEELIFAQDYVSQAMTVSRKAAVMAAHASPDDIPFTPYAVALSMTGADRQAMVHVPHIQAHLPEVHIAERADARLSVVQARLDQLNLRASASMGRYQMVKVDWPLPTPMPMVSIIIPTRDKVSLLRACVDGLLTGTSYEPFEILVVDNGSQQTSTLTYLDQLSRHPAVRILRDGRPYNFSQLNNMAAAKAEGSYLCLLNNDTEILDDSWLTALMRQAVRPTAGAVGARLLYADRSIQHAGVVVGLGDAAGHAHRFAASADLGYFGRTHAAQYVSAVTAACLVVAKDKYLAVGGLDEESLAVAFNDVDLCLKLQANGWRNIYTPEATLLHHESKSRGKDISPQHIDRYRRELATLQKRWGTKHYKDPLHHPHLDRTSESYLIRL